MNKLPVTPSLTPSDRPIVDAHTHIFPPEFARDRESICFRDEWFAELYQNPKSVLATEEDILKSMSDAGYRSSIVCGFPWRDPGLCREHNDYLLDVARPKRWTDRCDHHGLSDANRRREGSRALF